MTFSTLGTDTTTHQPVYLYKASRTQGLYIVGLQGMGKSGLLENLIIDDIKQGTGVCVLDPHGELIDHVIARLPSKAEEAKVIFLDIADYTYPFGLNLFTCSDLNNPFEVEKTVDRVMHIFDKLLGVSEDTPLISQYLLHCTHTLVANPGMTMAEIPLLLTNDTFRQKLVANVTKMQTRLFWDDYYDPKPLLDQRRESISIQRRVEKFLQDITLPIVGQSTSTIDMKKIMDESKILLVKLNRQMEQVTTLIGSMIVALILNAAGDPTRKIRQFHLFADEFQRFATEDFATLLEEARKAGIGITMAHQNRAQLELSDKQADAQLKARTLNVGSLAVFRVPTDAVSLAGQFDTTPPPGEPRFEYKRTPVQEPVSYMLSSGRSYPVETVNQFFSIWRPDYNIEWFQTGHRKGKVEIEYYGFEDRWEGEQVFSEDTHQNAQGINSFFSQVMRTKNPSIVFPMEQFYHVFFNLQPPCFDVEAFVEWRKNRTPYNYYPPHDYVSTLFDLHFGKVRIHSRVDSRSEDKFRSPIPFSLDEMKSIYDRFWLAQTEQELQEAFSDYENAIRSTLQSDLSFAAKDMLIYPGHTTYKGIMFSVGVNERQPRGEKQYRQEAQEAFVGELQRMFEEHGYAFMIDALFPLPKRLSVDTATFHIEQHPSVEFWYLEDFDKSLLQPAIEKEITRIIAIGKPSFEQVVRDIREICQLLIAQPIENTSGVVEAVPGIQLSSDEIKNRIANELVQLPKYTARVKLTDASDTIAEHTIATREPEKGLYGKMLEDRIARIQAQNRIPNPYGYTRPRQDVEVEIRMRQDALRQAQQPLPMRQRREEIKSEPVQQTASDSQLEQAIALLYQQWEQAKEAGIISPSLKFDEWVAQQKSKSLKQQDN